MTAACPACHRRYRDTTSYRDDNAAAADIDLLYRRAIANWHTATPITDTPPPTPRLHCTDCTNTYPLHAADQLAHHTRHQHGRPPTTSERTPR